MNMLYTQAFDSYTDDLCRIRGIVYALYHAFWNSESSMTSSPALHPRHRFHWCEREANRRRFDSGESRNGGFCVGTPHSYGLMATLFSHTCHPDEI